MGQFALKQTAILIHVFTLKRRKILAFTLDEARRSELFGAWLEFGKRLSLNSNKMFQF